MNDGWEQLYGFPPLVNNATDADPTNDLTADPDSDGLPNSLESQLGTNPRSADTDGDSHTDTAENLGASNGTGFTSTPNNPAGSSSAPPANALPPVVPVSVQVGDHSVSHSEQYKLVLEPLEGDLNTQIRTFSNSKYGEVQTHTFQLPAGAKYKITLKHTGTDPKYKDDPKPDYDYTLSLSYAGQEWSANIVTQDPQNMLGVHDEGYDFYAANRSATLNVVWLTSETVATKPSDRKRTKLGVIEQVDFEIIPASTPGTPTWTIEGNVGSSKIVPYPLNAKFAKLTAGFRTCSPTVKATIGGKILMKSLTVVQPSSIKVVKNAGDSNTASPLKVDFTATIYVAPEDVSFLGLTVAEKQCNAVANNYFNLPPNELNGRLHEPGTPLPVTSQLVQGKGWQCEGGDHIWGGPFSPPYGNVSSTFTWVIPWVYRYDGDEEPITNITHQMTLDIPSNNKAILKIVKTNDAQSTATQP